MTEIRSPSIMAILTGILRFCRSIWTQGRRADIAKVLPDFVAKGWARVRTGDGTESNACLYEWWLRAAGACGEEKREMNPSIWASSIMEPDDGV